MPAADRQTRTAHWEKMMRADPLVFLRHERVRMLCLDWLIHMGQTPSRAGVTFVGRLMRELSFAERLVTSPAEVAAIFRAAWALDDPALLEDLLAVRREFRNVLWGQTMASMCRHTFGSDEADMRLENWQSWLDAHAPKIRVPAGD